MELCRLPPVSVGRPDQPNPVRHPMSPRTNSERTSSASLVDHSLIRRIFSAALGTHEPSRRQQTPDHLQVTVRTRSGRAAFHAASIRGAESALTIEYEYPSLERKSP